MIDSVKTKGMTLKDASGLIKGELGSVVILTIIFPRDFAVIVASGIIMIANNESFQF